MSRSAEATVYTIGHSTRRWEEFLELLREYRIRCLIDVRRFPGSRRHPHFDRQQLRAALAQAGIAYEHREELGGRRTQRLPDSPNAGWRVAGFNAYADHLRGTEPQNALRQVLEQARHETVALMCAEAVPWRCHRQILADQLVAWGARVCHIIGPGQLQVHTLSAHARVGADGLVYYPAQPELPFDPPADDPAGDCDRQGVPPSTEARATDGGNEPTATVVADPAWEELADRLIGQITLVVGRVGSGKSSFIRWLAERWHERGARFAVLSCDMGQPLIGPPGAMWASLGPPDAIWKGWFIGDNSPVGNLVPAVTGAGRLVRELTAAGADTVLIDTTGLVDGGLGRMLKLHKAVAAGATAVVALGEDAAIAQITALLEAAGLRCHRLPRSPHARDRDWEERRRFREQRFRAYFEQAVLTLYPAEAVITMHWEPGLSPAAASLAPGRLCGLLDERFFCLGLGIIECLAPTGVFVRSRVSAPDRVAHVILGRLQVTPDGRELGRIKPS